MLKVVHTPTGGGKIYEPTAGSENSASHFITLDAGGQISVRIQFMRQPGNCDVWVEGGGLTAQMLTLIRSPEVIGTKKFARPYKLSGHEEVVKDFGLKLECPNGTIEIWYY